MIHCHIVKFFALLADSDLLQNGGRARQPSCADNRVDHPIQGPSYCSMMEEHPAEPVPEVQYIASADLQPVENLAVVEVGLLEPC